jgi:flagellar M-ring protein FliF
VQSVRVHLALPKRQLFEEDAEQASATVAMGLGGRDPSPDMVRAVQNLVSGAVLGMKVDRVTVVDQHGKTLSSGSDASLAGKLAEDQKVAVEGRIAKTVKDLVEGVVGPGRAQVKVTAQLDLNRVTVSEERFDPDGQVVRSESTSAQNASEQKADGANGVTAAGNIPGQAAANGFQPLGSTSGANDSVTNYEISKSVRTEVTEPGTVKKLSVAVAVDGATAVGADGKPGAYTPRSAQEMQQIQDLVRAAVGFDQARGDIVTVVNVRFPREDADAGGTTAANPLMGFDKNDIMRFAELGIAGLVAILILFFAVRPLMKSASGAGRRRRGRQRPTDAGQRQRLVRPPAAGHPLGRGDGRPARPGAGPADQHRQDRRPGEGQRHQAGLGIRREAPGGERLHPA